MTIIDVKNIIDDFFTNYSIPHSTFYMFAIDFLDVKDIKYPAVLIDVQSASIKMNASEYNIDVYIMDKVYRDKSNWLYIYTNCEGVLSDLISYLIKYNIPVNASEPIQVLPINDRFNDDDIGGCKSTISIRIPNNINKCQIPFYSNTAPILQENYAKILQENDNPILLE